VSEERQSANALVGAVLDGSYRVERMLGEGGMGAVYCATHLRLDKPVAIKVMARELGAASEALARFHREAMVTSNLGHPNIVQVFDFSTTPTGEPFLVMELLEGEDLERRLRREGRLSPATMLHIIKQVGAAALLLIGALLFFRLGPAPKPTAASAPPPAAPIPAAPPAATPEPVQAPIPAAGLAPSQPSPTADTADHDSPKPGPPESKGRLRATAPAESEPKRAHPARRRAVPRMIEDL
jgi:hypothetical protein